MATLTPPISMCPSTSLIDKEILSSSLWASDQRLFFGSAARTLSSNDLRTCVIVVKQDLIHWQLAIDESEQRLQNVLFRYEGSHAFAIREHTDIRAFELKKHFFYLGFRI